MTELLVAAWAVTIAVGAWLVLREEPTDPPKYSALSRPPGSADGARAGIPPVSGAGSTLDPPTRATSPGRPARRASGPHT